MGRIAKTEYNSLLFDWSGYFEIVPSHVGDISFWVTITAPLEDLSGLDVRVQGRDVTILAFDAGGTILEMRQFVPEAPS